MWRGISLANKCLLLFGAAVLLTIFAALSIPWLRMNSLVDESQKELSRQIVEVWRSGLVTDQPPPPLQGASAAPLAAPDLVGPPAPPWIKRGQSAGAVQARIPELGDADLAYLTPQDVQSAARNDPFIGRAWAAFRDRPGSDTASDPDDVAPGAPRKAVNELHEADWVGTDRLYHYARAERSGGALVGMYVLNRTSTGAARLLVINTAYLLSAGLIALGLAVLVFYLITSRLILSPVRSLKETAEMVREGNVSTRADIQTGDEFEELSETFNQMLENLAETQQHLRSLNTSLDLKVNELSEKNVALFEANKLKGEFLASVSHELRTPLNSIIGFAELLIEAAEKEADAGDDSSRLSRRRRYLENIHTAGRSLLEMINDLLDMAKLDAGKMELKVSPVNLRDKCEGWAALFRPQADREGIDLEVDLGDSDLPIMHTDADKLQQIVVNLLSNAIKFTGEKVSAERSAGGNGSLAVGESTAETPPASAAPMPRPGKVTLRAERLVARGSEGLEARDRVRISVLDTGPGIAPEDQKKIFEKFQQLDSGLARRHAGTGLGLAICKELTAMLQGEIQLESEVGRGSMFSVILPVELDGERAREMRLEMAFRGQLAGQKVER